VTADLEAALWRLFRAGQNYRNCWTPQAVMSVNMAARYVTEAVRHVEEVLEHGAASQGQRPWTPRWPPPRPAGDTTLFPVAVGSLALARGRVGRSGARGVEMAAAGR